jgi:hypothetical protein
MPTPRMDPEKLDRTIREYDRLRRDGLSESDACRRMGVARGTMHHYKKLAGWGASGAAKADEVPDVDDIDDLIAVRKAAFKRKASHEDATKLRRVVVKIDGPIGILHFGDPHVDDDGTDLQALEDHTGLCRSVEGLFAANVGDTTNNWTGRLARLYAEQGTTAKQAWMLAEWFVKRCHWLYMIGGNHDAWSGAGDPLHWIARGQTHIHSSSEARIGLEFSTGRRVIINARHDHTGHSMWNPTHGPMKALQLGTRDHIAVAGHTHTSGYSPIKDPETGRVCHAVRVASYKIYDRYAKERGFRDQHISPCALTVIDPSLPDTHGDMVKLFWDPFEGADYLKFKRKKFKR